MKKSKPQIQKRSTAVDSLPTRNEPGLACGELAISESSLRTLGIAGGDIYAAAVEEVQTTLTKVRGHRFNAFKDAIKRMKAEKLIDDVEAEHITAICKIVFAVHRKKQSASQARNEVGTMYRKMLVENKSGSIALAFASIAASENGPLRTSVPDVPEGTVAVASRQDSEILIMGGMLGGLLAGARIGAAVGGSGGVLGGLAGAIAGALIGAVVAGCDVA